MEKKIFFITYLDGIHWIHDSVLLQPEKNVRMKFNRDQLAAGLEQWSRHTMIPAVAPARRFAVREVFSGSASQSYSSSSSCWLFPSCKLLAEVTSDLFCCWVSLMITWQDTEPVLPGEDTVASGMDAVVVGVVVGDRDDIAEWNRDDECRKKGTRKEKEERKK